MRLKFMLRSEPLSYCFWPGQVTPVDKASVAIALLWSVIFLGEPLTYKTVIAVLMIIGGMIILIFQ